MIRPKPRRFTVDFFDAADPAPKVGDTVRDVGLRQTVRGYYRVVAVRQVKVKVSRGEVARYALQMERLSGKPDTGVTFTVYANRPRKKNPLEDRFSPLL